MQLDPSNDQVIMTDMFARFLNAESSIPRVRAALPGGFDHALWRGLALQGALSIRVPEEAGGLGLSIFDAVLLMEEAGRTLASGPLAEGIVAARLLAQFDPTDINGLRDAVASGESVLTLALHDLAAQPEQLVPGGGVAHAIIARDAETIVLIRPKTLQDKVEPTLASTPIARLALFRGDRKVLGDGPSSLAMYAAALEEWKLLIAAALIGLSKEAIQIASKYACERVQFGRPIGSYQAISHPLANAIVDVDAGRLMLWRAIRSIADDARDAGETVSVAAWWAGAAAEKATAQSLHTFGGYGLSLEYDIHLFNLRSRAWLLVLGDPELLLDEAARRRYGGEQVSLPESGEMTVEFNLGEDADALAEEARAFFEATLTPELRAKAHYSWGGHEAGMHKKLAEAGLLFPDWPKRIGGREVSTYAIEAAHKVWAHYNWTTHAQSTVNIIGLMIDRYGTEQCKKDILSKIVAGDVICSLGYSEPGSGSDVFAAKTRATQESDGSWRINGQKMFTSGAEHADYVLMLARTDPDAPKHQGISMFMVPLKADGVTIHEIKTFQDERTNITYYDAVKVPDAYRLGEINGGLKVMALALEIEQGMTFAPYQESMLQAAERLCRHIQRHGKPAIEDPVVQRRLTKVAANVLASTCLHNRILWVTAEGKQNFAYGPACKLFSSEAYRADSFDLLNLTAPESLAFISSDAAFINQCYRHSQVATVYGGTSEVQRSQIAEKQLNLPRTR